ncbi:MAG: UDP-N-acetylmuramoyl-tripeptide--D-alanyl-D-alanine ligase [Thermodesulfobacteriota bacterium]
MQVKGVSTDSRTVEEGNLFIPLKGEKFDGHDFIEEALNKGAAGSLCAEGRGQGWLGKKIDKKFLLVVRDTLHALGDLAHFWRKQFSLPVIALTGSNGKTTTKEMTSAILANRFFVLKTEGNFNNLIGLPLTLLKLSPQHEVAVLEMGMNAFGEIRRLREIAHPQISAILNIGQAHLEKLGGLAEVARAKGELWEELSTEDWIAVNLDDPWVTALAASTHCQKKTYSIQKQGDVQAEHIHYRPQKGIEFVLKIGEQKELVQMQVYGRHNVPNALAASTCASILGIGLEEIVAGLKAFQPYPGRGKIILLKKNIRIWDDTYNANPDSLRASLAAFLEIKGAGRGLLVLGDMLELGATAPVQHQEMGRFIGRCGFSFLFFLGKQAPFLKQGAQEAGLPADRIFVAVHEEDILLKLKEVSQENDWIMVKGSRLMKMERIIQGLQEFWGEK